MTAPSPTHPGKFITDVYLRPLGISHVQLATRLRVTLSTVSSLLAGEIELSPDMALRLSVVLGSSAYFWLGMQVNYSLWQAEQTLDVSTLGHGIDYGHLLANPIRCQIIELLENTEIALEEICQRLNISQDRLLPHLRSLEAAELLSMSQKSGQIYYDLNVPQINRLTQNLPACVMANHRS
ncbi:MAG: HigA family addiction module antitoxin [Cyanobacteria bacterium P01_F01_bin.116]